MSNQGCLVFLFKLFGAGGGRAGRTGRTSSESLPYRLRSDGLLTPTELAFYQVLRHAVGNAYTICPKVRLADIIETNPFNQAYHNQIDRKHIDFLLCEASSMRPVAGIELDDSSHQQASAQERDQVKDAAFRAAGLPLRRIPASQSYDPDQIRAVLQGEVTPGVIYAVATPRQMAPSGPVTPTPIVGEGKPPQ